MITQLSLLINEQAEGKKKEDETLGVLSDDQVKLVLKIKNVVAIYNPLIQKNTVLV